MEIAVLALIISLSGLLWQQNTINTLDIENMQVKSSNTKLKHSLREQEAQNYRLELEFEESRDDNAAINATRQKLREQHEALEREIDLNVHNKPKLDANAANKIWKSVIKDFN